AGAKGCDHRRGQGVVDAAREQNVQVVALAVGAEVLEKDLAHRVPENEAGPWTDVPAALTTFRDKAACAILEEHAQQAGRRYVQIGGDAFFLQGTGLVWPAAGDQGEGRPHGEDRLHLLPADLGRGEAEDARAPGSPGQLGAGLLKELDRL